MARPRKQETERSELEKDLLEAAEDMLAYMRGEDVECTVYPPDPQPADVQEIRSSVQLTQKQFAQLMGASLDTIRHWENGRRTPSGPAQRLLAVLKTNPRAVLDALQLN